MDAQSNSAAFPCQTGLLSHATSIDMQPSGTKARIPGSAVQALAKAKAEATIAPKSALRQRPDCRSGSRPVHLPDADELHAAGPIPPSAPPCEAVGPVPVASRPSLPLRGSFWRVARIPPTAPSPIPVVVKRVRLLLGSQDEGTAPSRP